MPTDNDNGGMGGGAPVSYGRAPAAPVFANPTGARTPAPGAAAAPIKPLETPEEQAARLARNSTITGVAGAGGGYIAPGQAAPIDPTGMDPNRWAEQTNFARTDAAVATGNQLPGAYQYEPSMGLQDSVHSNLSVGEANAQRQRDFGLGSNNNAQTAAMLGAANATGDKYSQAFGNLAGTAGANSAAAGARGIDMYAGNTSQYAQGLANAQASRGMQTDAYGALMGFANNGPGPSAAQAQLQQATDANTQNALAMARSGRGMGGGQAAMRQAISQNATTQQQANSQAAELRANENTAFQGQRLAAMGAAGNVAGQTVGADQAYGQLGLAGAQYQSDTALKGTQLNDASSQAWADRQAAAYSQGLGAEVGAQTQGLNINSTALTGRENEYASANQTYAANKGFAQAASIADANRQQAYVSAGLSTAGTVMGALSDERFKTNIQPLGVMGGNGVAPLASQSGGSVMGSISAKAGPTEEEASADRKRQTGGNIGKAAGSVAGGAAGSLLGPIGGIAGSVVGGAVGSTIGKLIGSDVRSKSNIRPLDQSNPFGNGFSGGTLPKPRELDNQNPFEQLQALASKYNAGGVAETPKAVTSYAKEKPPTEKQYAKFARDDSHPILSEGDALLAESARNAPGSTYEYKDPNSPGARPGMQTGPMAQDLASHPLTAGMVGQDPGSGKLFVDGSRAAMTGLAQNHAQQNQLDALNHKIGELEGLLKRKPGDSKATSFRPDQTAGRL